MTELLHMRDNYLREFDALVVDIGPDYVVLDRTAFYPEGGGQSGDQGTLSDGDNTARVVDTRKKGNEVYHMIEGPVPFEKGASVHGVLDWDRRYECMRFHTAQHILSRYLQTTHGLVTVSNMIHPGRSRADFQPIDHFTAELKQEIEQEVNAIISRGLDVRIEFMPRDEAIALLQEKGYQTRYLEMVPKSVTEFRLVIIDDYDYAACAGTHVANTREIGKLVIGKTKNVGAGKQRLYFSLTPPSSSE